MTRGETAFDKRPIVPFRPSGRDGAVGVFLSPPDAPCAMSTPDAFPFPEWTGQWTRHVTVSPDGFSDATVLRRFAAVHEAGGARITFVPSRETLTLENPRWATLNREGPRVPVPLGGGTGGQA